MVKFYIGALVVTRPLNPLFFKVAFWVGERDIKVGPLEGKSHDLRHLWPERSAVRELFQVGEIFSGEKYMFKHVYSNSTSEHLFSDGLVQLNHQLSTNGKLGDGFKYFLFSPVFGEMIQFD